MRPGRFKLGGPPLALQIMGLLIGGLLVAQLVTLVLTVMLPPAPPPQYELTDIAATLAGAAEHDKDLQRIFQKGPPDVHGPGWLVSEGSRQELAQLMGVGEDRVSLAFYTPLPFAGVTAPRTLAMANDGFVGTIRPAGRAQPASLLRAQFTPAAAAGAPLLMRGGRPGGAMFPGSPHRGWGEPGRFPRDTDPSERTRSEQPGPSATRFPDYPNRPLTPDNSAPATGIAGPPAPPRTAPAEGSADREAAGGIHTERLAQRAEAAPPPLWQFPATAAIQARDAATPDNTAATRSTAPIAPPVTRSPPPTSRPLTRPAPIALAPPRLQIDPATQRLDRAAPFRQPLPLIEASPEGPPIRITRERRSLFGLAPAPFVEGDFVAALKLGENNWVVVQPAAQPFPNAWQRRVLLWFVIALALVVPVGWLYARRLVKPIDRFAGAAEQLGRDPAAEIGTLDGPAEIGRAAHAFNLMQNRLRAFVDDRTAMVGAISHDLRTPLTRMRFRLEDVEDGEAREGLLEEVDEMEAMIAQVINFLRDASAPAKRERLDLATLVEDVVEDVRLVGGDVTVEHVEPARVEVDVLGMKRLIDNLLENAVKYGSRARVRLRIDLDEAVAEFLDEGPGLPPEEYERVFEPFYRSETAQGSDKPGSGLGLAVCRSIARAHGGDVRLKQTPDGFAAELRVPLVYGSDKQALV